MSENTPSIHEGSSGSNPDRRIYLEPVSAKSEKGIMSSIIKYHHSYKQGSVFCGRMINYFIKDKQSLTIYGVIGFGSSFFCTKARDDFIGWKESARWQNLQRIANNWRFTIKKGSPKYTATKALILGEKLIKRDWKRKYDESLLLLDTYIEPPRNGGIYLSAGWKCVGMTAGSDFTGRPFSQLENLKEYCVNLDANSTTRKLVFVKPLHKKFKKYLCTFVDTKKEKEIAELEKQFSDDDVDSVISEYNGLVDRYGALLILKQRGGTLS